MSGIAVQFGAGNIGRGFMAQLFQESGLEIVFVDKDSRLISSIEAQRAYPIVIVGRDAHSVLISNVHAVNVTNVSHVAALILEAEIVCTAVGANALPHLAPVIARGLMLRYRSGRPPLNIVLCENLHDAAARLQTAVKEALPVEERDAILGCVGFVQAIVSRMVPVQTADDHAEGALAVRVEAYERLPIDASNLVAPVTGLIGFEPVTDFEAHLARKLYTHNCAHAALGYLGYLAGLTYGWEALEDREIGARLRSVMQETGEALISRYRFDPAEHRDHVADLLERFANRSLGDTCRRLARDPIRKLAPGDRLVGAARLCEAEGVTPTALGHVISVALRYDDPVDPSAPQLQELLRTTGFDATLQTICDIRPGERLYTLISC